MRDNPFIHPTCGELAARTSDHLDYTKNRQVITCQGCGAVVERRWQHTTWTTWRTADGN